MKTLVSVFQKFKPWIISILILFLVIKLTLNYKYHTYLEAFTTSPTPTSDSSHHIYITDESQKTDYPSLTNIIQKIGGNSTKHLENGFLHLYKPFGKYKFDESSYSTTIPQLIIQSYPECPTLYNLFRAYPKLGAEAKIKHYSNLVEEINKIVKTAEEKLEGSITDRDIYMKDLEKYRKAYSDMRARVLIMRERDTFDKLAASPTPSETVITAESERNTNIQEIKNTYLSPSPAPAFDDPSSFLIDLFEYSIGYDSYYDTKLKSLLISTPNTIKTKLEALEQQLNNLNFLTYNVNGLHSQIMGHIRNIKSARLFKFDMAKKTQFENLLLNEEFYKVEDFINDFRVEEDIREEHLADQKKLSEKLSKFLEEVQYIRYSPSNFTYKSDNVAFNLIYTKNLYDYLTNDLKFNHIDVQKQFACPASDYAVDFKFEVVTKNTILNLDTLENSLVFNPLVINPNSVTLLICKNIGIIDNRNTFRDIQAVDPKSQDIYKKIVCVLDYDKLKDYLNEIFMKPPKQKDDNIIENIETEIKNWIKNQIICYNDDKHSGRLLFYISAAGTDELASQRDDDGVYATQTAPALEICDETISITPSDSDDLSEHLNLKYQDSKNREIYPIIIEIYKLFYLGENKIYNEDTYPLKYINIVKTAGDNKFFFKSEYHNNSFRFNCYKIKEKIDKNPNFYHFENIKYENLINKFKDLSSYIESTNSPCPSDEFEESEELSPGPSISKNRILELIKDKYSFACPEINNYFDENKGYMITRHHPDTNLTNVYTLFNDINSKRGEIYKIIDEIITYLDSSSISPSPSGAPATYLPETCKDTKGTPPTATPNIFNDLKCYLENELEPVKNNYLQSKIDLHNLVHYILRLNRLADQEQTVSEDESNLAAKKLQSEIETKLLETIYKKYRQNENRVGIEHRMKIQRQFFNLNQDIRVDYPLLDITVYDKSNDEFTPIVPQIYFSNQMYDTEEDFNSKAKGTEVLRYLEKGYDERNSHFAVKEDFSFPDILKFMDYSFTTLCWGAISIRLMKHTHNHYYAFPCQNSNCQNGTNSYFYLLPTKIAQLCRDEGKEYTRAKCNRCSSNVIVYFDNIPTKFLNLADYQGSEDNTLIEDLIPSSS